MKRFYKDVTTAEGEGGWKVLLDGRPVKTVGGRVQALPTRALAEAMAAEWAGQGEEILPALFFLRDLADYAIDVVGPDRDMAIRLILPYGETDTLCYRGDPGEALTRRQETVWEPLLKGAEQRLGVHFERVAGIIHRPQPAATMMRLETVLMTKADFELAALNTLANLAASLVIGLAALDDGADPDALWNAANLEEDWQTELWGNDAEAAARRAHRSHTFAAAARFAALARG